MILLTLWFVSLSSRLIWPCTISTYVHQNPQWLLQQLTTSLQDACFFFFLEVPRKKRELLATGYQPITADRQDRNVARYAHVPDTKQTFCTILVSINPFFSFPKRGRTTKSCVEPQIIFQKPLNIITKIKSCYIIFFIPLCGKKYRNGSQTLPHQKGA